MGGNVNPAGQPPTRSTSGSLAPRPAAKRRLETGTVSFEFLLLTCVVFWFQATGLTV